MEISGIKLPKSHEILGTRIAATDYETAFGLVSEWARVSTEARLVEAANTHVVALARHDRIFRKVIDRFDLIVPDGMPLIWVLNQRYDAQLKDRVYGPTLMAKCFEWSQERGQEHLRHFFLGSTPEILQKLTQNFSQTYPNANLVGSHSPPFRELEEPDLQRIVNDLEETRANLIWVCFGCPKQEKFLADLKDRLPAGVYFGIGAAFAFHAGVVSQAPRWIQRIGLEWVYRLVAEPRRLWKRYLVYNSLFIGYLLNDVLRGCPERNQTAE